VTGWLVAAWITSLLAAFTAGTAAVLWQELTPQQREGALILTSTLVMLTLAFGLVGMPVR
jgi:hypothetical protein